MGIVTLKHLGEHELYRLYWPESGVAIEGPVDWMPDGSYVFRHDGERRLIDGIPAGWQGNEIEVTVSLEEN